MKKLKATGKSGGRTTTVTSCDVLEVLLKAKQLTLGAFQSSAIQSAKLSEFIRMHFRVTEDGMIRIVPDDQ